MLQESGLWKQLVAASQQPVPQQVPVWKLVTRWSAATIAFLAAVSGLYAAYPWLSVQKDELLDPSNQFSEMFVVKNDGYIPTTDMEVLCVPFFETSKHVAFDGIAQRWPTFNISYLGHDGFATLPCFQIPEVLSNFGTPKGTSRLIIEIRYAYYHLNTRRLRRSQSFEFVSTPNANGVQHWMFKSN